MVLGPLPHLLYCKVILLNRVIQHYMGSFCWWIIDTLSHQTWYRLSLIDRKGKPITRTDVNSDRNESISLPE